MIYTILGNDADFFANAIFDTDGDIALTPVSESTTQLAFDNADTGLSSRLDGTNLALDGNGNPVSGTVTGITVFNGATSIGTITGIGWDLVALFQALQALEANETDVGQLAALFNQTAPITVDATGATDNIDFESVFEDFVGAVNGLTYRASPFDDNDAVGTSANDRFEFPGGEDFSFNQIEATDGNDIYDFTATNDRVFAFISYEQGFAATRGAITATIDGVADTGTIQAGGFTDTVLGVANILNDEGFGILGSEFGDTFNIVQREEGWFEAIGGEGSDVFNLTRAENSNIRLNFSFGARADPDQGIVIDLGAGTITNDGFGTADTLNVTGTGGSLEVRGTEFGDSMTGSAENDRFIPEEGNDTIDGGDGFDAVRYDRNGVGPVNVDLIAGVATGTWDGNAFADSLSNIEEVRGSREGDDTLRGGAEGERLDGRGGNDFIEGRGGNDYLPGREGNDTLIGGAGDDLLEGGEGNDTLRSGEGRDNLRGGDGDDLLDGSGGSSDSQGFGDLMQPGLGEDTILGNEAHWNTGEGADLFYGDLSGVNGMTITSGVDGSGTAVSGDGRVNDTFAFIHYFVGSQDGDSITGSNEDRFEGFQGRIGDDTINGGGSAGLNRVDYWNDHFDGATDGINADLVAGTVIDGFGDTDTLININGIIGSIFDDEISAAGATTGFDINGDEGNDSITGGGGDDRIDGGEQFDTISAGAGNDTVAGDNGRDLVFLNEGNDLFNDNSQGDEFGRDTVWAGFGNDTIQGGNGDDEFYGQVGNDVINARLGNDLVFGGDGFDTISAGNGADTVFGGNGRDLVSLNQGNDLFSDNGQGGELGRDTVWAGFGDDTVEGGNGDDAFYGQAGNDVINARLGNDSLFGGDGFDTLAAGEGNDTAFGGNGRDLVFLGLGDDLFNDNPQGGELGRDTVFGGAGNDTIQGGNGDDAFYGQVGNDVINGRLGNDSLFGGDGFDTIFAGNGNDTVFGGNGRDVVFLGLGDDLFNDNPQGGDLGRDTVFGGAGNDTIEGGNGGDVFRGEIGNDVINARLGNDLIVGGDGDDTLDGGGGADSFFFDNTDGSDVVLGFESGVDQVLLTEGGSFSASNDGTDTTLVYDATTVVFEDAILVASDIVLA